MTSEEIQLHLSAGKLVTQVSLAWQDKLSFVLDDKLVIKRLRFEDLLQEQAEQDGGDDALAQLDASFVLMMLTFRELLPALIEALGGEEVPQSI
ncbi:Recombination-associated protein RdgC [compost metagenome]